MRDIIDYKIVSAPDPLKLQDLVRASMNKGWTVWGSVGIFPSETIVRGTTAIQVMVKFKPESQN